MNFRTKPFLLVSLFALSVSVCQGKDAPNFPELLRDLKGKSEENLSPTFFSINDAHGLLSQRDIDESAKSSVKLSPKDSGDFQDVIARMKSGYGQVNHPMTIYSGLFVCRIEGQKYFLFYSILRQEGGDLAIVNSGPREESNFNVTKPYHSKEIVPLLIRWDPFLKERMQEIK